MAADFTNAVYTAYNLPNGLSINSSTGEISGTPTVGSTHLITVVQMVVQMRLSRKALGTITTLLLPAVQNLAPQVPKM